MRRAEFERTRRVEGARLIDPQPGQHANWPLPRLASPCECPPALRRSGIDSSASIRWNTRTAKDFLRHVEVNLREIAERAKEDVFALRIRSRQSSASVWRAELRGGRSDRDDEREAPAHHVEK
jgi:hypothetical protein